MKCKKCGIEIEENRPSGYCGYCDYRLMKEKNKSENGSSNVGSGSDQGENEAKPALRNRIDAGSLLRPDNSSNESIPIRENPLQKEPILREIKEKPLVRAGEQTPSPRIRTSPPKPQPKIDNPVKRDSPVQSIKPEISPLINSEALAQTPPQNLFSMQSIITAGSPNPNYDIEIEENLLATIANDPFIFTKVKAGGLTLDMFINPGIKKIARAVFELFAVKADTVLDKNILINHIKQKGQLDSRTQNMITRIFSIPPLKLDKALSYTEILSKREQIERLKLIAQDIMEFTNDQGKYSGMNVVDFSGHMMQQIRNVSSKSSDTKVRLIKEQMIEIVHNINARESEGEIENLGLSLKPLYDLNSALSGFRNGFLYGIAGAPRRGKTTLTLEFATLIASNEKVPVLFITWEQTKINLTYRLLAKESQINPDTLQRKRVLADDEMEQKFQFGWKKMERYMDYFYLVEGTKQDTIDKIRSYCYNIMQEHQTDRMVLFVDYIQKMPLANDIADEKFKVEEMTTLLKGLSIELNIPIIAISSLNKEGCMLDETDSEERPTMFHCKGSGDIEYDLDAAIVMSKDWDDTKELRNQLVAKAESLGKDSVHVPNILVVNVNLDKNRDAPEGKSPVIQYFFFIESNKFVEFGFKLPNDVYRFTKIEKIINQMMEEGYIVFRDPEGTESDDGELGKRKKKIRLKY